MIPRAETGGAARIMAAAAVALAGLALTPPGAAAQTACGGGYTVGAGETLAEIATRCGVTIPALLALNPAVRDRMDLEVGDHLRVPSPDAPQPSPQQACGPYYTTRSGDTLAEIAEKCGLTIPLLVAANGPLPDPLGVKGDVQIRIPNLPASAVRDPATVAFPPAAAVAAAQIAAAEIAAADSAAADSAAAAQPEEVVELTRVEGVLVAGQRCRLVRSGEGRVFAITGRTTDAFRPGDRVVVLGHVADPEACGHDPTLEVRILYRGQER